MNNQAPPSFSIARKWSLSLNVLLSVLAVLALMVMINYLAARHFWRLPVSTLNEVDLSPLTRRVIASVTNDVRVIIYFDKTEPLYHSVHALLKEYKFANYKIEVESVDYVRDPAAANLVKARYKFNQPTEKNLIIFDCDSRTRFVYDGELSDLDIQPLISGQSKEIRRTHFKGEVLFTSALLSVTTSRTLKACFLQGHGEHRLDNDDKLMGYSKFAGLLRENAIQYDVLSLEGATEVPADCHLLIIAGPIYPLLPEELSKIDRYLSQGGRLLVLFNNYQTLNKQLGLEKILNNWGVEVGRNVVFDQKNTYTGKDMVVTTFTGHPLIRPLIQSRLYLVLPRSVGKAAAGSRSTDAVQVEVLATTSAEGRIATDIRKDGDIYLSPDDVTGPAPLMVAVEKGAIRKVLADRGSTRMVVAGDSIFLGNETIDKLANREFASHALNWLLARNELLVSIPPRPIKEYKIIISGSQLSAVRWILMLGMPGSILLLGLLVSVRRRK